MDGETKKHDGEQKVRVGKKLKISLGILGPGALLSRDISAIPLPSKRWKKKTNPSEKLSSIVFTPPLRRFFCGFNPWSTRSVEVEYCLFLARKHSSIAKTGTVTRASAAGLTPCWDSLRFPKRHGPSAQVRFESSSLHSGR